jgi:hypothetical protein
MAVGAVLVGAVWLLPALGQECSGFRGYPGSEFYCQGRLGPTHYWLNDHLFAAWAAGTGALYLLWFLVGSGRRALARLHPRSN